MNKCKRFINTGKVLLHLVFAVSISRSGEKKTRKSQSILRKFTPIYPTDSHKQLCGPTERMETV